MHCFQHCAGANRKTENIVIVTLDGMRWQEVFGGADSALINNINYTKDTADTKVNSGAIMQKKGERNYSLFCGALLRSRDSYMATGSTTTL